jgi:hypothetical protein
MTIKKQRSVSAIIIAALAIVGNIQAQNVEKQDSKTNAVQALLDIAKAYHRPIIGELVKPIPSAIVLDVIGKRNERDALVSLAAQCPGYIWYEKNGVIVFGNERLLRAPGNPMNAKLRAYTIPSNLSIFKLTFPGAVESAGSPSTGAGGFVNGFGLPEDLSPPLTVEEVKDMEARNIMIKVAAEVGDFFSVIILPSDKPTKSSLGDKAFIAWDIAGGRGVQKYNTPLSHSP